MKNLCKVALCAIAIVMVALSLSATPRKVHVVGLGNWKKVPYSQAGDPAGAAENERELKVRPLIVDGNIKEWTTGDSHDVTDRSFVVRRAIRLNDSLPTDKTGNHWVWQRGPWLMVDRVSGHITALKLPDYSPGVSQVSWFRDYGAYCGLTTTGKALYAVVTQVSVHRPLLAKKIGAFDPVKHPNPVCGVGDWQREPFRITFHPAGQDAVSYEIVPGSVVMVEDSGDEGAAESSGQQ